jgi:hypothetical protein
LVVVRVEAAMTHLVLSTVCVIVSICVWVCVRVALVKVVVKELIWVTYIVVGGRGLGTLAVADVDTDVWLGLLLIPPHTPNPPWHPSPQWSLVLPHHPFLEQQFPKPDPAHVKPSWPPQLPSFETCNCAAVVYTNAESVVVSSLASMVARHLLITVSDMGAQRGREGYEGDDLLTNVPPRSLK